MEKMGRRLTGSSGEIFSDFFLNIRWKHSELSVVCREKGYSGAAHRFGSSFSDDELEEALFNIHPDKSPGIDGMNVAFY